MKLEEKVILLVSPEPWSKIMVSKHHYAIHLSKANNKVFFLNPPGEENQVETIDDTLHVVDYKPQYRGLQKLPHWINALLIKKEIGRLESLCKQSFDVVWSFDPSRLFNLSRVKALKVCHIVDWNQKFQRKLLAKTSDICFSTTSFLVAELKKHNAHSYFINHGYNPWGGEKKSAPIHQQNDRTTAGYVGNLNIKYLDWPMIHEICATNTQVDFYFLGPYDLTRSSDALLMVYELSNTHFLGPVESTDVASYLRQLDVLILAYRADEFPIQLANPHKMLEYLGSGKPIVATYTQQYAESNEIINMSTTNKSYPKLFADTMYNLQAQSTSELASKRERFAVENSYEKQIGRIESLLSKL